MVSRGVFYFVTAILFVAGLLMMFYQHINYEVPWLPGQARDLWNVEAKIEFMPAGNSPVDVRFALPAVQPGLVQVKQATSSLGYGVDYVNRNGSNYVEWTKRQVSGPQVLYYRADFLLDENAAQSSMRVPAISETVEPEPYNTAIREIADLAQERSADPFSFASQVIRELQKPSESHSLLLNHYSLSNLVVRILQSAKIHAREIGVVQLENYRRHRPLQSRVAVFSGNKYQIFDPKTGISGLKSGKSREVIWTDNGNPLLNITGAQAARTKDGQSARVSFTMMHHRISSIRAGQLKAGIDRASGSEFIPLSIGSLPIDEQAMFKMFLLLPVGILIVVFLRIIVGVKTSGTFMPVLIAMAFLETDLVVGLIGFIAIIGVGLVVRSWLSHLNLLLIARISAVIIVVICIIGSVSVFSYKFGLTEGLKVTFFPMIILSWTIERMSIVWEEEGYHEVLKQGAGSIFVAVCGYLAMNSLTVQHLTSNFLGLQLVILSLILVMGNYTGFRLTELKRFKPLTLQIRKFHNGDQQYEEHDELKRERQELKRDPHNVYRKWKKEAQEQLRKLNETDSHAQVKSDNQDNGGKR